MPLRRNADGQYEYYAGAGAFDPVGDVEREAARRGASPEEAARISTDVLARGQTGLTNFFVGTDPGVIYGSMPADYDPLGFKPAGGLTYAQSSKASKKADSGGGGADKAAIDVAMGYLNDQLALQRDIALAQSQQGQMSAQQQVAELGARLLGLESQLRGPKNAIQYSNLRYGLEGGDYPAILRKIAGLSFPGTANPNPSLRAVDLNRLPNEVVGNAPGVLRAFDPNAADIRTVRNLTPYDADLYQNFAESAGIDWTDLMTAISRFFPKGSAVGAARLGVGSIPD